MANSTAAEDDKKKLVEEETIFRFFGFTPTILKTHMVNKIIDKWATVYDSHIASTLIDPTFSPEQKQTFSTEILNSIYAGGKLHMMFGTWKDYIGSKVLNIPSNITRPDDEYLAEADACNDQEKLDEEEIEWQKRILELRAHIQIVEAERESTRAARQAIQEFKQAAVNNGGN